ncbi:hypothetical protein JK359_01825 [Streptomyces actinomycinicus]|uniref:Uncharacterized protein n=1 Tax=Streptomyces actinomycinicus TaxID=1695166 RepID=A0A937EDV8_9ACTN|nr:hypothetical protein [Streptomyces actinomycinicus]MBL1080723.1 hypothetical protein [Streptomyces actinomycinicus]
MNQRKDAYRAAMRPRQDTAAASPPPRRVTALDTRYLKVTVELDPAFARDLTSWAGPPLAALARVGEAVLRPLRQGR